MVNCILNVVVILLLSQAALSRKLASTGGDSCAQVADVDRFDCDPSSVLTAASCADRGCCWNQPKDDENAPHCYYPDSFDAGYQVAGLVEGEDNVEITLKRVSASGFPDDAPTVRVQVISIDESKLRIRIDDPTTNRFEVPVPPLNNKPKRELTGKQYQVDVTQSGTVTVTRRSTGTVVFNSDLRRLVFSNQFLSLSSKVPGKALYGLGEHKDSFRKELSWRTYTMLNADRQPEKNLSGYGTHPFYLMPEDSDGHTHGVLFFNNNMQDIVLQPSPAVTFRTTGGILDFYLYLGPTATDVVSQHLGLIGRPPLPPLWGLGFHLCRWNYGSVTKTHEALTRTIQAGIPIDVQWNDIDYMNKYNDFTYDNAGAFSELRQFVDYLHVNGMRWVPIMDAAVSGTEAPGTYPPLDDGLALDLFVKDIHGDVFHGKVWNLNSSVFPDYTHPQIVPYWTKQFKAFYQQLPLDGIWLDMNEPSNNVGLPSDCPYDNPLESPPYVPGGILVSNNTLCMTAQHHIGPHYDVHNMYGLFMAKATREALLAVKQNKRVFIISRDSATGHGNYGSHWTGDNYSTWENLRASIAACLDFNLFGIPLIGADICGFAGNTTAQLCQRWSALGAFYPFSRNHNTRDTIDQDPAALGLEVADAARNALNIRYSLLPYLYTQFYRATVYGETVMRALFFEFPLDSVTYGIEYQFLWGSSIMINPVVFEDTTTLEAYFPQGRWFDFETRSVLKESGPGRTLTLQVPYDKISVAIRGGSVITTQEPGPNVAKQRERGFDLLVALDEENKATGQLYWDDGESENSLQMHEYSLVEFSADQNTLTSKVLSNGYSGEMMTTAVNILGLNQNVHKVTLNGQEVKFTYSNGTLTFADFAIHLNQPFILKWFY